nr:GreA/GreB family elongation factor [Symbiobacterium terraclitae]
MEEYFSSPGSAGGQYSVRQQLRRYVEVAGQLLDRLGEQPGDSTVDVVFMDMPVTLVDEADGSEAVYVVVGPDEGDPARGHISCLSPLGLALLLRRVNERVVIDAPGGQFTYRIAAVSTEPLAQ